MCVGVTLVTSVKVVLLIYNKNNPRINTTQQIVHMSSNKVAKKSKYHLNQHKVKVF